MKKILFASTALIATGGMAAAEVVFDGYGRFGLYYQENATSTVDGVEGDADETRIEQRFRLTITGQTETDNGVGLEGRIRFQTDDQTNGTSNIARNSAAGFAVTAGGLRLDVGHVSDVVDSGDVLSYYGTGVGLTSFLEISTGHGLPANGFGVSDDGSEIAPTVKLKYEINSFTVSASITDNTAVTGDGDGNDNINLSNDTAEYQLGVGYSFGNYSVGLIYGETDEFAATVDNPATPDINEFTDESDYIALGFSGDLGAFGFDVLVTDVDSDGWDTSFGVGVNYELSAATTLIAVVSHSGAPAQEDDETSYGIGARHDLGGGVSLRGGIGEVAGNTVADMGVIFNF